MRKKKLPHSISEWVTYILERPVLTSTLVLFLLALAVTGLSLPYYLSDFTNFYGQVLAEAHGMLFDIAIIGILIFWLNKNGEKRQRIRTYKDEIDDFRLWESEEAAFRTVGNIKRLNRHKIYDLNLAHCYLARTNLASVKLSHANLNSANLSDANLAEADFCEARLNQTVLQNANLNQANLKGCYGSGARFIDTFLIKANLEHAFLIKADFTRAFLMEANMRGAYLMGADFSQANLYKADLRGAEGLTVEQFANVRNIYLARFDPEFYTQLERAYPHLLHEELQTAPAFKEERLEQLVS